jgi:hypothetical protein
MTACCLVSLCRVDLLADDTAPPVTAADPVFDTNGARRLPWSVFYYHSLMTDNSIWQVLEAKDVTFKYGSINTVDVSYELQHENAFRRFWQPLVGTIHVAANVSERNDPRGKIVEFAPYVMWRWRHLPLEQYLVTTIGVGDGISYVTASPQREEAAGGGKSVLNYLALEATFSLPGHPQLELVARVHHRSPAWGLFGESQSSNAIGIGGRYLFLKWF